MEKFTYKVAFFTHEISVGKDLITYKDKSIPANQVTGIGFGLVNIGRQVAGQLLGGIAGAIIAEKGFSGNGPLDKNLTNLPGAMGQIVITYSEDGTNQKVLRVPISTTDENCKRMLETIAKDFSTKFVGFGGQPVVEKELKISQKAAWIAVGIIFAIIIGIGVFAALSEGQF
jgi:hypothetical protein